MDMHHKPMRNALECFSILHTSASVNMPSFKLAKHLNGKEILGMHQRDAPKFALSQEIGKNLPVDSMIMAVGRVQTDQLRGISHCFKRPMMRFRSGNLSMLHVPQHKNIITSNFQAEMVFEC